MAQAVVVDVAVVRVHVTMNHAMIRVVVAVAVAAVVVD